MGSLEFSLNMLSLRCLNILVEWSIYSNTWVCHTVERSGERNLRIFSLLTQGDEVIVQNSSLLVYNLQHYPQRCVLWSEPLDILNQEDRCGVFRSVFKGFLNNSDIHPADSHWSLDNDIFIFNLSLVETLGFPPTTFSPTGNLMELERECFGVIQSWVWISCLPCNLKEFGHFFQSPWASTC